MLTQNLLNRKRSPGDGLMLLFAAIVIAFLFSLSPATATPAVAHSEPSTCSISIDKATGSKNIFVGHVKDGEKLWLQQDGKSKRIYRGHTYTGSKGAASVHTDVGWVTVCSR